MKISAVNRVRHLAIAALLLLANSPALAAEATQGAGSTFVFPVLSRWSAAYQAETGKKVGYESNGSGAGLAQVRAGTVDFGASDMPLRPDELAKAGLGQFPLVIGGVVPVVNVEGVKPGKLRFTGPLLADIFLGKIRKWDDPAIRELNPDIRLPSAAIIVVHRIDVSGTTYNFSNYLSKVSPEWKQKVGEGAALDWPLGVGGNGNEGVATYVAICRNSISYVEYSYALKNRLAFGLVQNKAGRFAEPNAQSFQAAAAGAEWDDTREFYRVMTDAPGDDSYPIAATSFILMPKQPKDPAKSRSALEFFRWALESGRDSAIALNYAPLPPELVRRIDSYWKSEFAFQQFIGSR